MRYLGSITAASGGYNNLQTGASGIGTFTVPTGIKRLYLVAQQSGTTFELFQGVTGGTNTTDARGAQLPQGVPAGPFQIVSQAMTCVAIYNNAGGFVSVRVYSAPNP